jgi:hypothetical protein
MCWRNVICYSVTTRLDSFGQDRPWTATAMVGIVSGLIAVAGRSCLDHFPIVCSIGRVAD